MKARITTILSLTGVLVAGSAAALVNTQVLRNSGPASASADNLTISNTVPDTAGPTTLAPGTTLAPVVTTAAPVSTQAVYQIGDAGMVTLDTAGDVLAVVSAAPNAGWVVTASQNSDPLNIEVDFQAGTTVVRFRANLLFGVVATSVETSSLDSGNSGTTSGNNTATPGSGSTHHSDDGSDDHGGDDHGGDDGADD